MPREGGEVLNRVLFWVMAALAAAGDLISKHLVFSGNLADAEIKKEVISGVLWMTRHINRGGVWGIGTGHNTLLIAVTALIIPSVVLLAYSCRAKSAPLWALGLLLGGAVGNLYDRITVSGVRDFIDFGWWPVFNVADIAIVIGVAVYVGWSMMFAPPETAPQETQKKQEEHA